MLADWTGLEYSVVVVLGSLQLFQLRLSRSKAKKSNMSGKRLLGVAIKNTNIERNLVSRDT